MTDAQLSIRSAAATNTDALDSAFPDQTPLRRSFGSESVRAAAASDEPTPALASIVAPGQPLTPIGQNLAADSIRAAASEDMPTSALASALDSGAVSNGMPLSTAGPDVLASIERDMAAKRSRDARIAEASKEGEEAKKLLQKTVYDNANPSPVTMALIVIAVVTILYILYVLFMKPCLDGEWRDDLNNVLEIDHNRFSGEFKVWLNGEFAGIGRVEGNYVQFGDLNGLWNCRNRIMFTEGWEIRRVW